MIKIELFDPNDLNPSSELFAQYFYLNHKEVKYIHKIFKKIQKDKSMDPISVDQFLQFFRLQKIPLYDYLFSISINGKLNWNQFFQFCIVLSLSPMIAIFYFVVIVMPTNTGLISLEDILLLCQMTGRNQLAFQIVTTQFETLDINHDGFLTISQFCHFIAVTINIWEPLYRLRFSLITKLFPSKDYYERIFERRLNINEIKEYQQSHKGRYKKLSCIKYMTLLFKNQPHPDHYDYEPSGNEVNKYNFATRSMKLMDTNMLSGVNSNYNNKNKRSNSAVVVPENNKNINNVNSNFNNNNLKVSLTLESLIGFYICKYKSMNSQKKNNNNNSTMVIPMNESCSEANESNRESAATNTANASPQLKPCQRPSQQIQILTPVHRYNQQQQQQQQQLHNNNNQHKSHFKLKYLRLKYPYKVINTIDHYYDLNYKQMYNKRKKTNDNNNQLNGEAFSSRLSGLNNTESFKSEDSQCFVFNSNNNNRKNRPSSSILKANRFTKTSSTLSENQSYFGGNFNTTTNNNNPVSPSNVYSGRMNNVSAQTKVILPNSFLESPSHAKMYKSKQKNCQMDFNVMTESESNVDKDK